MLYTLHTCSRAQDPTGEAASEAQKHLTLYELDLGLNHVVGCCSCIKWLPGHARAAGACCWCLLAPPVVQPRRCGAGAPGGHRSCGT